MNNPVNAVNTKEFYHHNEARYAAANGGTVPPGSGDSRVVDDVIINYQNPNMPQNHEFMIQWVALGTPLPAPRLCCFDESIFALLEQLEVLLILRDHPNIQPPEFCAALLALGYTDSTRRE